jgi:hypothetical protein
VPLMIIAVAGISEREAGLASGLINTAQQVGGALGLAILSTVATTRTAHVLAGGAHDAAAQAGALTEGFQAAFAVGAGFAIFGIILTAVLVPRVRKEQLQDVPVAV